MSKAGSSTSSRSYPYGRNPVGTGRRRAQLRDLATFYTDSPAARAKLAATEEKHSQGVPYDEVHFPRVSPEPEPQP